MAAGCVEKHAQTPEHTLARPPRPAQKRRLGYNFNIGRMKAMSSCCSGLAFPNGRQVYFSF